MLPPSLPSPSLLPPSLLPPSLPSPSLLSPSQVDPLAPHPLPSALLEQYQLLVKQEEECQQAIRDIEWEISEIIRTRTQQVDSSGLPGMQEQQTPLALDGGNVRCQLIYFCEGPPSSSSTSPTGAKHHACYALL